MDNEEEICEKCGEPMEGGVCDNCEEEENEDK